MILFLLNFEIKIYIKLKNKQDFFNKDQTQIIITCKKYIFNEINVEKAFFNAAYKPYMGTQKKNEFEY